MGPTEVEPPRGDRPLAGVSVVRIEASRAAELLCSLLAQQGAKVIALDQHDAAPGRDELDQVLAGADVVIDPRPPGACGAGGRSPEALSARSGGRVIYCVLPSFSSFDATWRDVRASDQLLAAMTGSYFPDGEGGVVLNALPVSACFAAFAAALGVAAALVARERDGLGQLLEVPEFDATFLAAGAKALLVNGQRAAERPSDPWAGPMRCRDGRYVWINLATKKAIRAFATELGRLEAWEREGPLVGADLSPSAPGRAELRRELVGIFERRDAADWDELGVRSGLAMTAVRTRAGEATGRAAQSVAAALACGEQPATGLRQERVVEVAAFGAEALRPSAAPSVPWFGARGQEGPWAAAGPATAPLTGVRVLDVSQMLAGPLAGKLLADLGADVIKVNDPHEDGAGYRWQENRYHTDVNRGKSTVLLDLTTEEGRQISERLIEGADVLVENMRADAAVRLGLDEPRVRALSPDICHGHVAAFSLETRSDAPGYEPNAQAIAGLTLAHPASGVPRLQPFPVNDYGTGLLCAYGVVLALFQRSRRAGGTRVRVSLSNTAFFYARAAREQESAGRRDGLPKGRLVRTQDGWAVVDGELPVGAHLGGSEHPSLQELLEVCANAGVPACALATCERHAKRPDLEARGVMVRHRYGDDYVVTAVGNPIRLTRTPVVRGRWVARPGKDGPSVLRGLGIDGQRQARMLASGVLALG